MLTNLRNKIQKDEEGFTLVELMVVVLIMAILMAIAIPTFMGAQNKAKDSAVKADLRNAMTAAKSLAADQEGKFVSTGSTNLTASDMNTAEPSITFATPATNAAVGVYPGTAGADITFVKISKSGKVYGISSTANGKVTYCSHASDITAINSNANCTGAAW
jgi:type IV pilus assembly protein PilA